MLVNYYLEEYLVIIEHKYKHLIIAPNDMKQRIHVIGKQKQTVLLCATQKFTL